MWSDLIKPVANSQGHLRWQYRTQYTTIKLWIPSRRSNIMGYVTKKDILANWIKMDFQHWDSVDEPEDTGRSWIQRWLLDWVWLHCSFLLRLTSPVLLSSNGRPKFQSHFHRGELSPVLNEIPKGVRGDSTGGEGTALSPSLMNDCLISIKSSPKA